MYPQVWLKNSAFCPHSANIGFRVVLPLNHFFPLWPSLYGISNGSELCSRRGRKWIPIHGCLLYRILRRAIAQAISWRPVSAEASVRFQISPCEINNGQSGTGTGFLLVLRFSNVSIIPPVLHTRFHLHVALTRKTNGRSLRNSKRQCCFGNRGVLYRKVLSYLVVFKELSITFYKFFDVYVHFCQSLSVEPYMSC